MTAAARAAAAITYRADIIVMLVVLCIMISTAWKRERERERNNNKRVSDTSTNKKFNHENDNSHTERGAVATRASDSFAVLRNEMRDCSGTRAQGLESCVHDGVKNAFESCRRSKKTTVRQRPQQDPFVIRCFAPLPPSTMGLGSTSSRFFLSSSLFESLSPHRAPFCVASSTWIPPFFSSFLSSYLLNKC